MALETKKIYWASHISQDTKVDEDDVPLAQLSTKSQFQIFLPTPDYEHVETRPRKKALNYKGQRVTKDLFNDNETNTKKKSKVVPKKKSNFTGVNKKNSEELSKESDASKQMKGNQTKCTTGKTTKTTKDTNSIKRGTESWYCHACHRDKILDLRPCTDCAKWYHEACIGLTRSDLDPFLCPDCDEN